MHEQFLRLSVQLHQMAVSVLVIDLKPRLLVIHEGAESDTAAAVADRQAFH